MRRRPFMSSAMTISSARASRPSRKMSSPRAQSRSRPDQRDHLCDQRARLQRREQMRACPTSCSSSSTGATVLYAAFFAGEYWDDRSMCCPRTSSTHRGDQRAERHFMAPTAGQRRDQHHHAAIPPRPRAQAFLEAGGRATSNGAAPRSMAGASATISPISAYVDGYHFSPTRGASAAAMPRMPGRGRKAASVSTGARGTISSPLKDDIFQASEEPGSSSSVQGRDLVGTWQHRFADSSSLQSAGLLCKSGQALHRQRRRRLPRRHVRSQAPSINSISARGDQFVWGAEDRIISYEVENTASLLFVPAGRTHQPPQDALCPGHDLWSPRAMDPRQRSFPG